MRIRELLARRGKNPDALRGVSLRAKRGVALAVTAMLLGGGSLITASSPAFAGATVTSLDVVVVSDGTEPFDADDTPGNDSGQKNGVVRAQDTVTWGISATEGTGSNAVYKMTLPAGMVFDSGSAAAATCDGPTGGSISSGNVLTCSRTAAGGDASFNVSAKVGAVANGTDVALRVDVDGLSVTSPSVKVSAKPQSSIKTDSVTPSAGGTYDGQLGANISLQLNVGVFADATTTGPRGLYGYEALASPITFTLDVPPGVLPLPAGALGNTYTFSQPGGAGTPVT